MPKPISPSDKNLFLSKKLQSLHIPCKVIKETLIFPDGLRPLVNEISNGLVPIASESASSTLSLGAYSGNNPVLSRLSQQKRLLVNAPRNQVQLSLISLLKEIPSSLQVRIIVLGLKDAKELKNNLLGQGVSSYYVENGINSSIIASNLRISPRSKVGSVAFSLQSADLVIFADSNMLVDSASRGVITKSNSKHNLSELFDPTFPTHIPPAANVLGFQSNRLPLDSCRHLWTLFSIDTLSLDANGSVIPTIYYRLVEFHHKHPPKPSIGCISNFEVLKTFIWANQERNEFIARLAGDLAETPINKRKLISAEESMERESPLIIGLLCTNITQGNAVIKSYDNYKLLVSKVETSPQLELEPVIDGAITDCARNAYIRADAGIGMLDGFRPSASCLLIDIVDKNLPNLDKSTQSRVEAYRRAGFVQEGNGLFLSRWNGV